MRELLRRMVEGHTEVTEFLVSVVTRGATPRYLRLQDHSDADAVTSNLTTTISDFGIATNHVIASRSEERAPR